MIDISFEIGGKKVSPNNIQNALESAMVSEITNSIKKSVQGITCPDHGGRPKLKVKGRNLKKLSVEVSGCCDKLTDRVQQKLK